MQEVWLAVEGANRRLEAQYQLALFQAYHTASWVLDALLVVNTKGKHKFPEWKDVIAKYKAAAKTTTGEAQAQVPTWQLHRDLMQARAEQDKKAGKGRKRLKRGQSWRAQLSQD